MQPFETVAGDAMAVLAAVEQAPPVASLSGPVTRFGLTPREVEVLALLARRLTDREIAEALFISPKTAGYHVGNILGKLGVADRREAAARAVSEGLT